MLVSYEGLAILSLLKIQSGPLGNLRDPPFDGDEMNLHMPQDPESEAELKNLAAVPYQIVSPANNQAIIGIYQDSMLGCYQFTRPDINFSPRDAMNILMMFDGINEKELLETIEKNGSLSNFDILSQIMPPLSMKYKTNAFKEDKDDKATSNAIIEIRNGNYIRGQMDKSVLGSRTKGLLQRVCNDFGNMASAKFIDDLQNVITEYMKSSAFSVGISDLISDKKTNDDIVKVITKKKTDVKNLIDQIQIGIFQNNTGKTNEEEFETQVNSILNQATSESGKIGLNNLSKNNRFVTMVKAGSKGSDLNISFMISCLGQQNVDGKRIPYGFEHRTLPHYTKYDDSPGARGFVENSYIDGLTPQELFFHAMGGRIGLIDTAVKTSTTGYIQRRLIKGLEDLMVAYDMTVRTNKNKIVQFSYGYDNIDTIKVEDQSMPIVTMSTQDIYSHFIVPQESGNIKTLNNIFLKNTMLRLKKQNTDFMDKTNTYVEMMINMRELIIKNVFNNKGDTNVSSPVAFSYIINNIQGQCNISISSLVDITLLEALEMIENCYKNLEKNFYASPTNLFKTLYYYYLSPKELLIVKRFNKAALTLLLDTITMDYKRAIIAPGEMVGMIAAQSIGEVSTQMTLNSVTYETPIIVRNRYGNIHKIEIGEFIEKNINDPKKLQYYKDKDTTYAEINDYYEIPSCTEDGKIVWKRIEAVTRHPVVNKDGTNTMLKITTNENREVIATKAKSFLKLINGKIIEAEGDTLKVGDYLPVSLKQIDFNETRQLDLKTVLLPTEYIYTSEVEKAKSVMEEHQWWSKHSGKFFMLPYKRSDSFVAKFNDKLRNGCNTKTTLTANCVYTKQTNMCNYKIPEMLDLDYNFGYLVGAYAAEGCMTKTQISIANNDTDYFKPILELCEKMNITTKIYKNENKCKEGWTSQDLRIYNTVLCRILEKCCGKLSHNKFISDKIIFSNKGCILGFLDAYIGGDGTINKKDKSFVLSSVSKELLIDVQQALNILGIYSFITKPKKVTSNNRGSSNIKQLYTLFVRNTQAKKLANMLNMKLQYKQENLQIIINNNPKYEINRNATLIPNEIDGTIIMQKRQDDYQDVLFDKIIKIEEVQNTTNYAYDLTIEDTKNFNIYNGLALRDTFHFAGVASKSNVTRGVPRIEEILSLSSDIKQPTLTVFLKSEDERQKEKAQTIMYMLEHTRLEELVKSIEVCFDPDDLNTLINEDKDTIEQYKAFENMVSECSEVSLQNDENEKSKWIIRMEMDPEIMLEKNITMDDVNFTLKTCFDEQINCIYSDFNSDKLIFRLRMNEIIKSGSNRGGIKKPTVNPLDQSDQIYLLKNLQDQILKNVVLRGIKGIEKVILRKIIDNMVEHNGVYKKEDIWVLDTIGTNLLDVLGLDFIDNTRTISNDIVEIFNILGIEAARQAIYNELVEVVEFDGTYINFHNYSVLVDRMTFTHKLISIFRHGINNDNIGPIAKASFEETPEMFLKAARHAELDTLRGVSANVMCGQEGFFGTSAFQVILDIEEAQKLDAVSEYKPLNIDDEIDNFFGNIENPDDPCGINKISIQNNVSTIHAEDMGKDNSYDLGF
jgi:DNA-directed RNA polymerase beta' subunit